MFKRLIAFSSVILLTACAYTLDDSIQDIKVVTPGAHNAICYMYVNGTRYRIRPPQTTNISNSKEDLVVDCYAPGNRHKKVVIKPDIPISFAYNTAVPAVGHAIDYASGAMFKYPDIVTVDFTGAPVLPESLPAHNKPDIKQPEEYFLEEFRPGQPRLNSDRFIGENPIERRRRPQAVPEVADSYISESAEPTPMKGDLQVIESLPPGLDPSGGATPSGGDPGAAPIPLHPGN